VAAIAAGGPAMRRKFNFTVEDNPALLPVAEEPKSWICPGFNNFADQNPVCPACGRSLEGTKNEEKYNS
jgi:hypothetical protein